MNAQQVVSHLIGEAMDRRGFLGRLGALLGGMMAAPLPALTAKAPVAAVAAAPFNPAGWTVGMQELLDQIRQRFVKEKAAGYTNQAGRQIVGSGIEAAKAAWAQNADKFAPLLLKPDPDLLKRFGHRLLNSPPCQYDPNGVLDAATKAWADHRAQQKALQPKLDAELKRRQAQEREAWTSRGRERAQLDRRELEAAQDEVPPVRGRNLRDEPKQFIHRHQFESGAALASALLD